MKPENKDPVPFELLRAVEPKAELLTLANGLPVALLPSGWTASGLTNMVPPRPPEFRRAAVNLQCVGSFVDYVKRFGGEDTVIYIDAEKFSMEVVIDDGTRKTPGRRVNRATYQTVLDERFVDWSNWCKKDWIPRKTFIEFLEDHDSDFLTPSGGEMKTLAKNLDVKRSTEFLAVERDDSAANDMNLVFKTETTENGQMKLPRELVIALPIFRQGQRWQIPVRLKFDINETGLCFRMRMHERQRLIDNAWQAVANDLAQQLGHVAELKDTPVLIGHAPTGTIADDLKIVW